MELIFTVGNPADVFEEPFASSVKTVLHERFGSSLILDRQIELYWSDDVLLSDRTQLREQAISLLGSENIPQFLGIEAWRTVYLPFSLTDIENVAIPDTPTPLQCYSLPRLVQEMERFAEVLELPTDELGLRELTAQDVGDEDLIHAYTQLMLAAKQAATRNQPLWMVRSDDDWVRSIYFGKK